MGRIKQLFDDVRECILNRKMDLQTVLKTVTSNVAKVLRLYPQKGVLSVGSDADILVLDERDLTIESLLIKGTIYINERKIVKKGKYEG